MFFLVTLTPHEDFQTNQLLLVTPINKPQPSQKDVMNVFVPMEWLRGNDTVHTASLHDVSIPEVIPTPVKSRAARYHKKSSEKKEKKQEAADTETRVTRGGPGLTQRAAGGADLLPRLPLGVIWSVKGDEARREAASGVKSQRTSVSILSRVAAPCSGNL
ncbi:hypothetical protein O3P69_020672 [Scylla paramamosain]|uniref:Uncharacterized protein n=1 Tax=Scylla paramamosain TaxID=85552 RepID=A0AAW0TP72_SCYPA